MGTAQFGGLLRIDGVEFIRKDPTERGQAQERARKLDQGQPFGVVLATDDVGMGLNIYSCGGIRRNYY